MPRTSWAGAAAAILGLSCGAAMGQDCWDEGFGSPGASATVRAFAKHDHGWGPALYVAGDFESAGGGFTEYVAASYNNGQTWEGLAGGIGGSLLSHRVSAMAVYRNDLYVGGWFDRAGPLEVSRIARWDGFEWSSLPGLGSSVLFSQLFGPECMYVWDAGNGPQLYVGGNFTYAGGITVNSIARWDGAVWRTLGLGVAGNGATVKAMAAFQGKLYVGGEFQTAGGVAAGRLATWDGTTWAAVPGGALNGSVNGMKVFNDGSGEALYVVGNFSSVGSYSIAGVGRFNGQAWTRLGAGVRSIFSDEVNAIDVFDSGTGPALHVGGAFHTSSPAPGGWGLARWNGSAWEAVGGGVTGNPDPGGTAIHALRNIDGELYVGGQFWLSGHIFSNNMARMSCPFSPCYANCDGSTAAPVLNVADFTCFLGRFASQDPYANCDQSTVQPVLNVADFTCFLSEFAAGCR